MHHNSAIRSLDQSVTPSVMSSTTGTIAFGTTFLALAAGLAVFAAVRNRDQFGGPISTPPPSYFLTTTSSYYHPENYLKMTSTLSTFVEFTSSTTKTTPVTTKSSTLKPTTTVVSPLTAATQPAPITTTRLVNRFRNRRPYPTTTAIASPIYFNELDVKESYFDDSEIAAAAQHFDMSDSDIRRLLTMSRKRAHTGTTTPKSYVVKTTRNYNSRRLFAPISPSEASNWHYPQRSGMINPQLSDALPSLPATSTPTTLTSVIFNSDFGPRTHRQQPENILFSSVLNDAPYTASRPSNSVRRRSTTAARLFRNVFTPIERNYFSSASPLVPNQVFAEERPLWPENIATPSPPFLLTLFTSVPQDLNETAKNSTTPPDASLLSLRDDDANSLTPRQSHRRSVLNKSKEMGAAELATSTPAATLLVIIGVLLIVAALLMVALFMQRRHLLAKIRGGGNAVGHCSVVPLPIAIPANSAHIATIMDSGASSSSAPSSSDSSPRSSSKSRPQHSTSFKYQSGQQSLMGASNQVSSNFMVNSADFFLSSSNPSSPGILPAYIMRQDDCDPDDIINAMASISGELVDSSSSSNPKYPMPLHHY